MENYLALNLVQMKVLLGSELGLLLGEHKGELLGVELGTLLSEEERKLLSIKLGTDDGVLLGKKMVLSSVHYLMMKKEHYLIPNLVMC